MKMSEIKSKNEQELHKLLADGREAARKFRFEVAGSRTRNVKEGRAVRKDIARILTELQIRAPQTTI
jgi:ribosomal protein L29